MIRATVKGADWTPHTTH